MAVFVCPGSFDPITNGHVDIIKRALVHCDRLIIAVGDNAAKKSFFTLDEKITLLKKVFNDDRIEIDFFRGLTEEYARKRKATALVRGLRALSDFEYEFQMALLNRKLNSELETLFIMTNPDYSFISSGAVRELIVNGGDITGMVPECIREDILQLYNNKLK